MKCYINYKFTTIAWGLVFIIILFCGCSNMIERLRLLTGDNIDIYISYYDRPITEFELGLGNNTGFYFIFVDRETKELVNNYSMIKSIEWHLPASDNYINFSTNSNKLTLFLVGKKASDKQNPYEISVTVNGKKSYPCFVSVANYYTAATEEELQGILSDVPNSSINEIHITGDTLLSSPNSLIQIAQQLPGDRSYKYTLDLSEATNIDLSTDFGNYPSDIEFFNSSVGEIILPEGIKDIGENALWGFTALERINIPSTVETIGNGALSGTKIREIVIPGSVRSIGNDAFDRCLQLSSISFENSSDGLKLGDDVFASCNSLAEITIPARITHLGDRSFFRCEKLSKITFESRESPIFVGERAFEKCPLSEVIIEDGKKDNITGAGADNLKKYIKDQTTP